MASGRWHSEQFLVVQILHWVELPSVSGAYSKLGLTIAARIISKHARQIGGKIIFWGLDLRWPCSLIFSTENWHSTFSFPGERLYHFLRFFLFELRARTGQTYGRARRVMRPTGRPRNKYLRTFSDWMPFLSLNKQRHRLKLCNNSRLLRKSYKILFCRSLYIDRKYRNMYQRWCVSWISSRCDNQLLDRML